ncbi:hypothetical protein S40288_00271 [Stachybotrys chartarum IBT 40288]|nr:hypothetical protein S40288_00271 [Stachybotrys chartarum IBT 40288]
MKFLLVALAGLMTAAAVPAPAPPDIRSAWCVRPGQPCWKVKRAAEAFAEAISDAGPLEARAPEADVGIMAGRAAFAAKRSLTDLSNLLARSTDNLGLAKDKRAPQNPWCTRPGQPCWFTEGEDEPATEKRSPQNPWCTRPGQPCWFTDGETNPESTEADKRWCTRPGQPCWKAKRAAEAVLAANADMEKREAEADADADAEAWCTRPGQPCWKKRQARWCTRPGQPCWKAKRDLEAVHAIARDLIADLE